MLEVDIYLPCLWPNHQMWKPQHLPEPEEPFSAGKSYAINDKGNILIFK